MPFNILFLFFFFFGDMLTHSTASLKQAGRQAGEMSATLSLYVYILNIISRLKSLLYSCLLVYHRSLSQDLCLTSNIHKTTTTRVLFLCFCLCSFIYFWYENCNLVRNIRGYSVTQKKMVHNSQLNGSQRDS